ncbi:hypothetical protein HT886_000474 [Salmonella enterica]|uniref:Bacteriophage protein n=2 Tax=Salmonella enterica TaxID=28901 RepID=A0A2I5HFD6_SALDZ|nr:hypothetical protein [Salmonella enterica]EBH8034036.1 hypothetical protein [Salmonella bongori]EBH8149425.1 hypothetical protein [Salmonella enterica subsp. enterica serovar Bareilly str. CFSAN000189]EBX2871881.1 hypothetical protein [Salmonella enterica subsp. enterica serovar Muenchen]ECH8734035.1 hypothetical protein [Salmonella enterica subsp. enterica serovar Wandsworth]EFS0438353.1 hypothetical protein [Salmonella enterica subsp. enterica serovar Newport]EGP3874740.1 hypothetical pr
MNQEQHAHKSRLPKGAFKGRPIALRLTPEVRKTVEELAKKELRTDCNMAHVIFMRGLDIITQEGEEKE